MKCPKCQAENPEGMNFCGECGAKIETVCPNCNFPNPLQFKFCGKCGHQLSLSAKPVLKEISFDEKLARIQKYLPSGLSEKILAQRGKIEGERRQVTVMFCDMKGYTPLTEKLGEEEAYALMDQVYEILIHKVHDYEGTVNEMTGDGIMALFGAPIALEDAPQRAIRSALAIHREIANFSEKIKDEKQIPPLRMRIGIHTGPVVVGTLGNDLRVEFKAVGDTVNLASRMEGLAEPGTTYITKDTHRLVREYFEFKALGEVQVKGKEKPIEAFQVLGLGPAKSRLEAAKARGLAAFIGRRKELEILMERFGRVKAGRGQVIGIVGEAGIGKSRMVLEFKNSLEKEEMTCLEGQCHAFEQSTPYQFFMEIIRKYFEIEEGDRWSSAWKKISDKLGTLDKALMGIIPFLGDMLSLSRDDLTLQRAGPEEKRRLTFEAVKALFLRESQARPLIIIPDNLQWVDKASQNLLDYLVESIPNARVLLLGIYRPGYLHPWSDKSYYSHITLNPLSEEESATLAKVLLKVENLTEDLRCLVLNRAEGNPLYVEEIIHWLLDMGAIARAEKGYVTAETSSKLSVPDSIQEVIMARIDRLEQDLKRTMQIASVIGRDFLYRLLRKISDMGDALQAYLMKLQGLEFIYEKNLFPELEYMFKHILIQDVAYHSLLKQTRKQFHERIGIAMEEIYKEQLDEHCEKLAYHYQQGSNREKALEYLVLAAKKAANRFANVEALNFCKEALKILDQLANTEQNQKLRKDFEFLQLGLKVISDEIVPF
jgi:class 3 adenylate cyclase/ABC-type dipeptide/oligopeptide/nickel transport system ATPase component